MTREVLVLCFVLICSTLSSEAAEQYSAINKAPAQSPATPADLSPAFNIFFDGSVPADFDSNINRVPQNAISDFHFSPFLKLSAITDLRPDLTYSIYADTSVDRYSQYYNTDSNMAGVGTQLTKKWDTLQLGAIYDWTQDYDRDVRKVIGSNNDFSVFLRYSYSTPDTSFRIKPSFSVTSRLDDQLGMQRYLYYFKVDFEHKLIDHWSFIVTPRVRFYDYVGTQNGRQDWVYSASAGLRRVITEGLNFTTTIGYENRVSNLPGMNYDDWTVQASLDFSYAIFRSKSGAGSDFLEWYSH